MLLSTAMIHMINYSNTYYLLLTYSKTTHKIIPLLSHLKEFIIKSNILIAIHVKHYLIINNTNL